MNQKPNLSVFCNYSAPDGMQEILAILDYMAENEQQDRGLIVLLRIVRDSLSDLAERIVTERLPQAD